jgi:hypothetical protein
VNKWPPHFVHHFRLLPGVLLKVPILEAPFVTLSDSGFQSVNALTGPADQVRHDEQ